MVGQIGATGQKVRGQASQQSCRTKMLNFQRAAVLFYGLNRVNLYIILSHKFTSSRANDVDL